MSLGLVAADAERIYLAAESEGLQHNVIPSKIRRMQEEPTFAVVVTGGLDHWRHVFEAYTKQPTLQAACEEIVRLLNENMGPCNQAHGRLCGYEGEQAICYRIDRPLGSNAATWCKGPLTAVQMIGRPDHADAARRYAEKAISSGMGQEEALREAIESRIPRDDLRGPVESLVIERRRTRRCT